MLTHRGVDVTLGRVRNELLDKVYQDAKRVLDELGDFEGREHCTVHYPFSTGVGEIRTSPEEAFQFLADVQGVSHLLVYMAYVSEPRDYRYAVMYLLDTNNLQVFIQVWEKGDMSAWEMAPKQIRELSERLKDAGYRTPYENWRELMACLFFPTSN